MYTEYNQPKLHSNLLQEIKVYIKTQFDLIGCVLCFLLFLIFPLLLLFDNCVLAPLGNCFLKEGDLFLPITLDPSLELVPVFLVNYVRNHM